MKSMSCGIENFFVAECEVSNNFTLLFEIFIAVGLAIGLPSYFYKKERKERAGPDKLARQQKETIDKLEKTITKLEKIITNEEELKNRKVTESLKDIKILLEYAERSFISFQTIMENDELVKHLKEIIIEEKYVHSKHAVEHCSIFSKDSIIVLTPKFFNFIRGVYERIELDLPTEIRNSINFFIIDTARLFEYEDNLPKIFGLDEHGKKFYKIYLDSLMKHLGEVKIPLESFFPKPLKKE